MPIGLAFSKTMNKTPQPTRPSVFIPTPESDSNVNLAQCSDVSSQSVPSDKISNKLMERLIEEIDRKSDALQKVGQDCLNLRKICSVQEQEIKKLTENLKESDLKTKRLINAFDVDIIPVEELRRRYALLAGKLENALERLNIANDRISKLDNLEIEKRKLEKENVALRQAHTAQQHLVLDLQESVQKAQKFKIVIQKQESVISKLEESLSKSSMGSVLPNPESGTFAEFKARNSATQMMEHSQPKNFHSRSEGISDHQEKLPPATSSAQERDFEIYKKHAILLEENKSLQEKLSKLYQINDKTPDQDLVRQHQNLATENQRLQDELTKMSMESQKRRLSHSVKGDESVIDNLKFR